MNYLGLIHGVIALFLIGIFHPIVIKGEYYLGRKKLNIILFFSGLLALIISLRIENIIISTSLGIFAFSSFWGIKETIEQEERVRKGLFPRNPNRKYNY